MKCWACHGNGKCDVCDKQTRCKICRRLLFGGGSLCMECDTLQFSMKDYCVLCGRTIAMDVDRYIDRGNYCQECDSNIERDARGTYNLPWDVEN